MNIANMTNIYPGYSSIRFIPQMSFGRNQQQEIKEGEHCGRRMK